MSDTTRRGFLGALAGLAAAPLMPAPTTPAPLSAAEFADAMTLAPTAGYVLYDAFPPKRVAVYIAHEEVASFVVRHSHAGRGVEEWSPRSAHNAQNVGSNPTPATNLEPGS